MQQTPGHPSTRSVPMLATTAVAASRPMPGISATAQAGISRICCESRRSTRPMSACSCLTRLSCSSRLSISRRSRVAKRLGRYIGCFRDDQTRTGSLGIVVGRIGRKNASLIRPAPRHGPHDDAVCERQSTDRDCLKNLTLVLTRHICFSRSVHSKPGCGSDQVFQPHCLRIGELAQTEMGKLSTVSAALHSADGNPDVGGREAVDLEASAVKAGDLARDGGIAGPQICT